MRKRLKISEQDLVIYRTRSSNSKPTLKHLVLVLEIQRWGTQNQVVPPPEPGDRP